MAARLTPLQALMLSNLYVGRPMGFGSRRLCPAAGFALSGALSRNKRLLAGRGLLRFVGDGRWALTDAGSAAVEARQLRLDLIAEEGPDRTSPGW